MKAFPVRKISHPHHKTDISANAAGRFPQLFLKFFACTQGQKHTVIQTSAFPGTDTKLHLTPTAGDQDSSEQQSGICGTVRQKSAERTITICRKRQSRNSVKPRHYYLKSPTKSLSTQPLPEIVELPAPRFENTASWTALLPETTSLLVKAIRPKPPMVINTSAGR